VAAAAAAAGAAVVGVGVVVGDAARVGEVAEAAAGCNSA